MFSDWRRDLSTNNGVSIVPFHWGHAMMAELRPMDREYFDTVPDYANWLKSYAANDLSCTAIVGGKIACCFGVVQYWPGMAEGWMLTTDKVATHPVSLTKGALRYFNKVATILQLKRLQLTVDCHNSFAINWANALKFTPEGVMRNYGPNGNDYVMYARYF